LLAAHVRGARGAGGGDLHRSTSYTAARPQRLRRA